MALQSRKLKRPGVFKILVIAILCWLTTFIYFGSFGVRILNCSGLEIWKIELELKQDEHVITLGKYPGELLQTTNLKSTDAIPYRTSRWVSININNNTPWSEFRFYVDCKIASSYSNWTYIDSDELWNHFSVIRPNLMYWGPSYRIDDRCRITRIGRFSHSCDPVSPAHKLW